MKKPSNLFLLILFIITGVYTLIAALVNPDILTSTPNAYYNDLLNSLFDLRLDLNSTAKNDLSLFGDRWYMYWEPGPIFFIIPFFTVLGFEASDKIYTLVAGILNVVIFYLVLKEFIRYFKINISPLLTNIVLLNFAFASPNLYLSLSGRIWHTSQVIAIFYLLLFFLFLLKYLNNQSKRKFLILSVIFVNLAWFSRLTLVFNLLFLLYPLILDLKNDYKIKKIFLTYVFPTILFVLLFFTYNFLRFTDPLETGVRYQIGDVRFANNIQKGQLLSVVNIPHNLHHYFLNPIKFLSFWPPNIAIDHEGNSVFYVYPLVIFSLFYFIQLILGDKQTNKRFKYFLTITTVVLLLNLTFLLLYFATGWTQFGSRYFFDLIPALFLIAVVAIENNSLLIHLGIIIYAITVNILGARLFYM